VEKSEAAGDHLHLSSLPGAVREPMPSEIRPMLATLVDTPFDSREWIYEVKWDGFRAIAFVEQGGVHLVSRNQNDLTAAYPELSVMPACVRAKTAILDGEIVALDREGRSSFSLMQQRTGTASGPRRPRVQRATSPFFITPLTCSTSTATVCSAWTQRRAKSCCDRFWPRTSGCATPSISRTAFSSTAPPASAG